MRILRAFFFVLFLFSIRALGQQLSAPEPQAGRIIGTVTDTNDDAVPGATVVLEGLASQPRPDVITNGDGFFQLVNVPSAAPYRVKVSAKGFSDWASPEITLKPGQDLDLAQIKLTIAVVETTVSAISQEELAAEQVKDAEKQRVLGVIPNFYVAYDPRTVPLTSTLKFKLALRAATDAVSIGGAAFLAGIDQAADTPAYQQGAKGYGQRFGAVYADGITNIMIGGAILPSLLHQDPRYFYQGTGTTKSRFLHAVSAPFWCKNDNEKWGFNYSSIGGDFASSALSNLYYPKQDRGVGLAIGNVGIITGGRIANALAQEFVLPRFTKHAKGQD
ncbi:carboxypeptidase-like regulatory domain-containing protein [Edaphobacter albus]|uniref:carboxypeptidase-like regulatory domain-containing protein n=1 Tax=Edaphobacter sp. 4G125 TaxID=2763071 RepID=UPI00164416A2|nr:carboxypeptidase-like regulatory domain-containing protein [Edaphobacter sp. 4G125]QNI36145.1 carboxypeptidase regulatory-like domain-containing protein [Edaphobacter sp. 4G125]